MKPKPPQSRGARPILSPFAIRFVSEFGKDLNGAAAYRRAGGHCKNADHAAYDLLRKPQIKAMVAEAEERNLQANAITAQRMVEENRRLCLTSIKRFFDEDGNLLPINEWTEEMSAQVASIEIVKRNQTAGDTVIKVKFWNKNQALELMHKHLRLLPKATGLASPCESSSIRKWARAFHASISTSAVRV